MPGPFTSDIHVSWNAVTTNQDGTPTSDVAGYKIYAGRSSGVYTHSGSPKNVGNVTSATYTIDAPGDWFVAVAAYDNSANEGLKSTEVARSYILCGNF